MQRVSIILPTSGEDEGERGETQRAAFTVILDLGL